MDITIHACVANDSRLVLEAIPSDERLWTPQAENIWFRLVLPSTPPHGCGRVGQSLGVRRSGASATSPPGAGARFCAERLVALFGARLDRSRGGDALVELPGEIHTLVVDDDVPEMITLFHVRGSIDYNTAGVIGHDDVHTKIEMCRKHYAAVGLGEDYVDQFIR